MEVAKFCDQIVVLRNHHKMPQAVRLNGQNHKYGQTLNKHTLEHTMLEIVNASYRRIYQCLIIYFLGLTALMAIKYGLGLSDYVIPDPAEIWLTARHFFPLFFFAVVNSLSAVVLSHNLSICLATIVGIIGRLTIWVDSF